MPLTGGSRDYVVVGSDSGKIVIVEYSADKGCFEKVHAEVYGKTGCRRIVPGQFVATDPRGRAVMIGAIEKQKLVYILNRDTAGCDWNTQYWSDGSCQPLTPATSP